MQQKKCVLRSRHLIGLLLISASLIISGCKEDRNERISSIYGLKDDPTVENVQRIRDLWADPDRDVRATALNALVGLRVDDAAELARAGLEDQDGFVRATAAKLLGDLDSSPDAERLVTMLTSDSDPVVRLRAAQALERIGGPEAIAGLAQGLGDPMEDVRLAAVKGLSKLDPGFAKPDLARLLLEDPNYEIRVQAAHALGTTGDPEVRPLLEAALEDSNEFVRAAAANALRIHEAVRDGRPVPEEEPVEEVDAP
jgi:serine/threonine-protein kinase